MGLIDADDERGAECNLRPPFVRPGERVDDLQRNGLHILQRPDAFCFGLDAVLLAHFALIKPRDRVADLGTGTGVLCLLLADTEPSATFDAVEREPNMADMALRSVRMNGLQDRITVHALDLKQAPDILGAGAFSLVVCNPPYHHPGAATQSPNPAQAAARNALDTPIEEIAQAGARLLKNGGRMALVYPAFRAFALMTAMESKGLSPKRIQFVQDRPDKPPKLVLLDAVRRGGAQLHPLPTLILHQDDGSPTEAYRTMYSRN